MLAFLQNILTSLLVGYLSLTNSLADKLQSVLPTDDSSEEFAVASDSERLSIPDILIKNASFQSAAVSDSLASQSPAENIREALVNIYCTYTTDTYQRQTTGSGAIVSSDGVILTNAHVAQFLLLEAAELPGKAACVVRTGEPATDTYEAEILYIPPAWIRKNASQIASAEAHGTGERDYALLYIARSVGTTPMPAFFPYLASDTELVRRSDKGNQVTIAGYPAKTDGSSLSVSQQVATTTISDIYTFDTNLGDLFLLRGSSVGQHGISGSPVVNSSNKVIGLVSTRGNDTEQGSGSLNAITLSYIDRTMEEETGFGFVRNIGGDLPYRSRIFTTTLVPFLTYELTKNF